MADITAKNIKTADGLSLTIAIHNESLTKRETTLSLPEIMQQVDDSWAFLKSKVIDGAQKDPSLIKKAIPYLIYFRDRKIQELRLIIEENAGLKDILSAKLAELNEQIKTLIKLAGTLTATYRITTANPKLNDLLQADPCYEEEAAQFLNDNTPDNDEFDEAIEFSASDENIIVTQEDTEEFESDNLDTDESLELDSEQTEEDTSEINSDSEKESDEVNDLVEAQDDEQLKTDKNDTEFEEIHERNDIDTEEQLEVTSKEEEEQEELDSEEDLDEEEEEELDEVDVEEEFEEEEFEENETVVERENVTNDNDDEVEPFYHSETSDLDTDETANASEESGFIKFDENKKIDNANLYGKFGLFSQPKLAAQLTNNLTVENNNFRTFRLTASAA